ncbi:MAG: glycosyltransferase family 2 protein [Clostridium sp.]|nr:glycosyltransferase family 2 protein [Clostridium sp.]
MKPLVSVVIPTYNRSDFIIGCIDAVLESAYDNLEVLVVDNHSTDKTVELIEAQNYGDRVKLIRNKRNLMAAGARNVGIYHSKGELILLMDDDNLIDKQAISYMVEDMKEDDKIGIITALCIQYDMRETQVGNSAISLYTSKASWAHGDYRNDTAVIETDCCENMWMIRRDVVRKIGYIDMDYYIMMEDADYCRRIKLSGYKAVIDPKAQTVHYRVKSQNENAELRAWGIGKPIRAFYFAKNRSVYMRKFAPLVGKLLYFCFFAHAFLFYYCMKAIRYGRWDIAASYFKGYVTGMFIKIRRGLYIGYDGAEAE